MKKKRVLIPLIFMIVLTGAYLGLWHYSAQWFTKESVNFRARALEHGVTLLGQPPIIRNFPFVPEVEYTTGLVSGDTQILFPRVIVRGYPVPFTHLTLSFPEGVMLDGPSFKPDDWRLDSLQAKMIIPAHLPRDLGYESMSEWQKAGGKVDVVSYFLSRGMLYAQGSGHAQLDARLQPDLSLQSTLRGYESFVQEQIAIGRIEKFPGAMAIMVLNSMAVEDPQTLEKQVTLTVNVKNQLLSVGPVQAVPVPEIVWDRRSLPVPHQ